MIKDNVYSVLVDISGVERILEITYSINEKEGRKVIIRMSKFSKILNIIISTNQSVDFSFIYPWSRISQIC